jgi:hypothetical protein
MMRKIEKMRGQSTKGWVWNIFSKPGQHSDKKFPPSLFLSKGAYKEKNKVIWLFLTYLSCEAERIPRPGISAKHLTVSACYINIRSGMCNHTEKTTHKTGSKKYEHMAWYIMQKWDLLYCKTMLNLLGKNNRKLNECKYVTRISRCQQWTKIKEQCKFNTPAWQILFHTWPAFCSRNKAKRAKFNLHVLRMSVYKSFLSKA